MALQAEDMYEELGFDEAEGAAESFEEMEAADEFEEMDAADEFEEMDAADEFEEDSFEAMEEFEEFDEGEGFEEFEEVASFEDDALEEGMAYALAAEDTDEFFRRIRRLARRVAPVIGRVARIAAPILSRIPHPYAQAAGRIAGVAGRLLPQAESEEEALEAFAELAVINRRVVPLAAGIAARTIVGPRAATMSPTARRAAVRTLTRAARTLVQRGGPRAIRALPRIARTVRRTAAARGTPATARPQVVLRTAARVAATPRLARRLARPLPRGQRIARAAVARAGGPGLPGRALRPRGSAGSMMAEGSMGWRPGRAIRLRGPVQVTIRSA
jgi:hypothetical protein